VSLLEFLDPAYVKSKLDSFDSKLDVALSTRASESTLAAFSGKFPGAVTLGDAMSNPTTTIIGGALLGWDSAGGVWERVYTDGSNRLKVALDTLPNPSNLDVALSTRASESTLSSILGKLDVNLSTRLAETTFTSRWDGGIYGFDGTTARKIKTDAAGELQVDVLTLPNPSNLDVALSTRASETTLSAIKTQTDKLTFDAANRLTVNAAVVANPSNLDVALSTRASEATLSSILNKLDVNLSTRLADTKIPNALGQASLDVVGSTMYALGVVPSYLPSRMPYCIANISVGTTEGSTAIAAPGGKMLILRNRGDVDILVGVNGSVPATNPLILRARTIRIFPFSGVTAVYYKTATGSSTLDIEYWS